MLTLKGVSFLEGQRGMDSLLLLHLNCTVFNYTSPVIYPVPVIGGWSILVAHWYYYWLNRRICMEKMWNDAVCDFISLVSSVVLNSKSYPEPVKRSVTSTKIHRTCPSTMGRFLSRTRKTGSLPRPWLISTNRTRRAWLYPVVWISSCSALHWMKRESNKELLREIYQ